MKELEMRMLIRPGAIQAAGIAIVAALVKTVLKGPLFSL